jgi:hypothetical protein
MLGGNAMKISHRNRLLIACLLGGLAVSSVALSADFWTNPDFLQWQEKDARKMLSNSPWASEYAVPDPIGGQASAAGSVGATGGSMGRGQVPLQTFTIMWRSATPIKRALVRLMSADGLTPQAKEFLDRPEPDYVVGVAAAKQFFGPIPTDAEVLKSYAALRIKGQPDRKPSGVTLQDDQTGLSINYQFSRENAITLDDKDVEFVFEMPRAAQNGEKAPKPLNIKRKFALKNMVFEGKLDL